MTPEVYRIADVLAEWRGAERRLAGVDPATEDGRARSAEVELLRNQHQVLASKVACAKRSWNRARTWSLNVLTDPRG